MIDEDKSGETEAQCITAIDWNPSTDSLEFAYTDNTGQFGLIENINDLDENVIDHDNELAVEDDINFGDRMYFLHFYFLYFWYEIRNFKQKFYL